MNIKAIIASSLFATLFAGTSAIADFFPGDGVVTERVSYQSPLINDDIVLSGLKSVADYETTNSSVEMQKVSYQLGTLEIYDSVISGKK